MYINDGRKVEEHYIGYKCPHFICDLITPTHYMCESIRLRLDAIGKDERPEEEFLEMFSFNWEQFKLKHYGNSDSRIIES